MSLVLELETTGINKSDHNPVETEIEIRLNRWRDCNTETEVIPIWESGGWEKYQEETQELVDEIPETPESPMVETLTRRLHSAAMSAIPVTKPREHTETQCKLTQWKYTWKTDDNLKSQMHMRETRCSTG